MRLLALAALAVFFVACRQAPQESVVARVGPLAVTQAEFQKKIAEVAPGYQGYVTTPDGRRQFLDILIREKMILAAAKSSNIERGPAFKAQLQRLKSEEEERLREGRDYLVTQMWLEDLRAKGVIQVTEDEARGYWRRHPVEVEVRHILVATPGDAEALSKMARHGANFALLAKEKSLDAATAADGGRMPSAMYGEIIPDLEDVVFRMRIGEVGGPIKSKFGYHILRKESERKIKFEDAHERIMRLLERQKLDRYLQSIQEKFPVEVVDDQFK